MTDRITITSLKHLTESKEIECKQAAGKDGNGAVPDDMWATYSAMANTNGGVILLGVREKNGAFIASGINDIEKVKDMLQLISNKDCVIELLEPSGDITIKIGDENYIPEAKDCSVITAEYFLGGRPIGSVGLIGPQRINYSKVVTIMSQVMKELNKSLKDQEY